MKKNSFLLAAAATLFCASRLAAAPGVQITQLDDRLRIEINGRLFTEYHFKSGPRPYFYPVIGPDGLAMTRRWPAEPGDGEQHDHPHHRGMWFAHSRVDGKDFWNDNAPDASASRDGCRIVHDRFLEISSGADFGVVRSTDQWIDRDGAVLMTDERTLRVFARPDNERLFDFDITLRPPAGKPVVLGDDKDGAFAIRVAESMRLKRADGSPGAGHIALSTGVRDGAAWGQRAEWCDYSGPIDGRTVGIAIFDHPSNPRHPTWWHVRDYGLFAANPFGLHDFEHKPLGTGDMTIKPGKSVTFRYRVYMHEGDAQQGGVAARYRLYGRGVHSASP